MTGPRKRLESPLTELRNEGWWFVLQVAPGRERSVCEYADRYDLVTYFPRTKKMIKPPKKRKPILIETIHSVFPGYVFVLNQMNYRRLLQCEYSITFLKDNETPSRVSDFDIQQIQEVEEAGFLSRNRGIVVGDGFIVKVLGDISLPVESIGKDSFFLSAGVFRIKIPIAQSG